VDGFDEKCQKVAWSSIIRHRNLGKKQILPQKLLMKNDSC
jgi:hypothetical protein